MAAQNEFAADFNSSDAVDIDESQLNQNKFAHRGQETIEEITNNVMNDRLTSKKAWKGISFGTGTIMKQGSQWRWVNGLNAVRKATLGQTGDK